MKEKSPGYIEPSKDIPLIMFNKIVDFIGLFIVAPACDISPKSVKMEYVKSRFQELEIDYIHGMDYNFDKLSEKKYKTIFCFEVIEHLQNPLLFMRNLTELMDKNCTIYITMPGRPKLLWPKFHYFEIPPKHFEKWILEPLDLEIEKRKLIRVEKKFSFKVGFRPIIRLFMIPINGTWIYKIKRKSEIDKYQYPEFK